MSLLLTIVLGGLSGFIASKIVNRDQSMGILLNIVVGIVGAFLANLLIAPLIGIPAVLGAITLSGFLVSLAGAVLLLVIVNLITRGRVR